MKKDVIKRILYILGALMLGYIVVSSDWIKIWGHLKSTPLRAIMLLMYFQCITMLLINIQWKSLAGEIRDNISFIDIVLMNAKGNIVDSLTPGVKMGGEVGRIIALKNRAKISLADAAMIVGLQKTVSLLSFLLLTLVSLIWFSLNLGRDYKYHIYLFAGGTAVFFVILVALILFSLKPNTIIKVLEKIIKSSKTKEKIRNTLKKYSQKLRGLFKNKRLFFSQMALGIFIWSFYAFKLQVLMKSFNIHLDYISVAAITFIAYVMGMIPLLPGGIGSFESCMILLLKMTGIALEMAAVIAIVFRTITFWFEFILSGLILILANMAIFSRGDNNVKIQV